ncbi:MAG TPA: haloacid dehalogenase, partial [Massilia timonae]|nr:haloacid dehalogenase [Massilia timonae]
MTPVLPSWTDGPARDEIIDFVRRVTDEESSAHVPP